MTNHKVFISEVWETEVDRYRCRYCVRCGSYLSTQTCVCGLTVDSPEWMFERAKRNDLAAAAYDALIARRAIEDKEKWIYVSTLKQILSPNYLPCARDDARLRAPRVWSFGEWSEIRYRTMKSSVTGSRRTK